LPHWGPSFQHTNHHTTVIVVKVIALVSTVFEAPKEEDTKPPGALPTDLRLYNIT
jgi:hypothetical protein